MTPARQHGLTLPELLVALLVFSFVASAAVYALRLGVEARDQLTAADARISRLQIARTLIKEDLAQVVDRTTRDEFGAPVRAPFLGGMEARLQRPPPGETRLLAFVRAGWDNPGADAPRSSLQYVEYVEKDGALIRRIRPFLDDARGQPRFDRVLVSEVQNLSTGFLVGEVRGELDWAPSWPIAGGGNFAPQAVSITFETDRYGVLEQRFWIGEPGGRR